MKPYRRTSTATLYRGDCRRVLPELGPGVAHAIVTDPPYELGFMDKAWDRSGVSFDPATWSACLDALKPGGWLLAFGGSRTSHRIACAIEDAGFQIRDTIMWIYGGGFPKSRHALKPAFEPIIVARRPPRGSTAANVRAHGCGSLNIEASRVPTADRMVVNRGKRARGSVMTWSRDGSFDARGLYATPAGGRWPANVAHDGSPEVLELLGEPARFFYCGRATAADRGPGNDHPTVKPAPLMRWLVGLVAAPGSTVLDPFAGSGSTGKACRLGGVRFIGVEQDPRYLAIASRRVAG